MIGPEASMLRWLVGSTVALGFILAGQALSGGHAGSLVQGAAFSAIVGVSTSLLFALCDTEQLRRACAGLYTKCHRERSRDRAEVRC